MRTIVDIAWLAGLLEGEASFSLSGRKYVVIQLESADLDTIEKANKISGSEGKIGVIEPKQENHSRTYKIRISGDLAIQWMMTIYPLMSLRRKSKIRENIHLWKTYTKEKGREIEFINKAKSFGVPEEEIQEMLEKMKSKGKLEC